MTSPSDVVGVAQLPYVLLGSRLTSNSTGSTQTLETPFPTLAACA